MTMCVGGALASEMDHKWNADKEAMWRICHTVNASDQWEITHGLNLLPGSYEDLYYRAINRASDANGAHWNNGVVWTPGQSTEMGSENQQMAGESMYAMSYQDRCKKDITDWDAMMLLMKGVTDNERGVIESTWPTLTESAQHAILLVIKRSQFVTPITSDDMMRWK